MSISPGTERAITNLSSHAPELVRELNNLNTNLIELNVNLTKLNSVGGIPGRIGESLKDFKKWLADLGEEAKEKAGT